MQLKKIYCISVMICSFFVSVQCSFVKDFNDQGYVELADVYNNDLTFSNLYEYFDDFILFLQANPAWVQKLYSAKEKFIRLKIRNYYATDSFGFYDESEDKQRNQISFYYATDFHLFVCSLYPEINDIPELISFFEACFHIQNPYGKLFNQVAENLDIHDLFLKDQNPPVLFKVVKYLPSYTPIKPHYDGTVLTLLLHSTNPQALLLSTYKNALSVDDFYLPHRKIEASDTIRSMLLIPGTLLFQYGINPTPHVVVSSPQARYAAIAFAMRPYGSSSVDTFTSLPDFR